MSERGRAMEFDIAQNLARMETFVMTFNWIHLSVGLLLLIFPAEFLLSKRVQLRSFETFTSLENNPNAHPWWFVPLLFIDPIRGFGGAWLLRSGLGLASADGVFFRLPHFWMLAGALIAAVAIQTYTKRDHDVMIAPMGFLAGILVLLVPPVAAAITLVLAIAAVFGLRSFMGFFCVGLIVTPAVAIPFRGSITWVAIAGALFGLPVLLSVVSGRTLEIPTAKDPNKAKLSPLRS